MRPGSEVSVVTECLGCRAPWRTSLEYDAATWRLTVAMQHEGYGHREVLTAEAILQTDGTVVAAAIEHATGRLARECGCFDRFAPAPAPNWSWGDPRLGSIGSVA